MSQLQLAMIKFHNAICDDLNAADGLEGSNLYEEARRTVTWHYHWAVVNDFLVTMCGAAVVKNILSCGRKFYCPTMAFIPIEFAVAAYRFGHSMVPMKIQVQKGGNAEEFFGPVLGEGFSPLADEKAIIDWNELFNTPAKANVQKAEKLDTKMAGDLLELPLVGAGGEASLATRNLLRGNSFLLPSGEKVAALLDRPQAEIDKVLTLVSSLSKGAITEGVPVWLYVLAEAETIGRETTPGSFEKGEGLGPVGARIVAEVLIGLLEVDEHSFLGANRNWLPRPEFDTIGKMPASTNSSLL